MSNPLTLNCLTGNHPPSDLVGQAKKAYKENDLEKSKKILEILAKMENTQLTKNYIERLINDMSALQELQKEGKLVKITDFFKSKL